MSAGFIYVLKTEDGYYKIGRAAKLSRRIYQPKIQLPHKARLIGIIYSSTVEEDEREFHNDFADVRVNGEWFRLTEEHIQTLDFSAWLSRALAPEWALKEAGEFLATLQ